MGAVFAQTRFSLVRISIRDLVADRILSKEFWGWDQWGGGQNRILMTGVEVKSHIPLLVMIPPRSGILLDFVVDTKLIADPERLDCIVGQALSGTNYCFQ